MVYDPLQPGEIPNLVNLTKRLDPDGGIAAIAEILDQTNPILQDIPMVEGNLPTGHRTTVRSSTPEPTWRRLNYGVRNTKSETSQVDDTTGMLEDYGEVDKDLAMLNGNTAEFRLSEDRPHIEGMSNTMAQTIFYGDTATHPDRFLGLAPRYDDLTLASKPTAVTPSEFLKNIIDNGGIGANLTSIYFVCWGTDKVHGIYPKGSQIGLQANDLGEVTLMDSDGNKFQGYRSHYQWKMGMCVRDWRFVARLANIDLGTLLSSDAEMKALYQDMIKLMHAVPKAGRGSGVFYCSAAISAALDMAATEKGNLALSTVKDAFGEELTAFRKRPIRECDAILEHEAQVV